MRNSQLINLFEGFCRILQGIVLLLISLFGVYLIHDLGIRFIFSLYLVLIYLVYLGTGLMKIGLYIIIYGYYND